jgi:hypothetical protein
LLQHAQALSKWEAEIQEIVEGDAFVAATGTLNLIQQLSAEQLGDYRVVDGSEIAPPLLRLIIMKQNDILVG